MSLSPDRYILLLQKKLFSTWKERSLVKAEEAPGYFKNAYKRQEAWGWGLSFFLAIVAAAGSLLFFSAFVNEFTNFTVPIVFTGVAALVYVEVRYVTSDYFSSGDIEASLLVLGGCTLALLPAITKSDYNVFYWGLTGTGIFLILTWRYLSPLTLLVAFIFLCYFIVLTVKDFISAALLPFILMILFGSFYLSTAKIFHDVSVLWKRKVLLLRVLSLIVLILAGNYFVVRSLSESLLGTEGEIRFAFLFYAYSTAFPIFICYYGLKRQLRAELICGLLGLTAGILGIREYHSVMPIEYAFTLSGAVLLAIGYLTILALRKPMFGLSVEVDEKAGKVAQMNELVVGLVVTGKEPEAAVPNSNLEGGGEFGGGGAGSKF